MLPYSPSLAQLRHLSFTAPRLALEEWNALLTLSRLTDLCINHWGSPDGTSTLYPASKAAGFDPRPLSLRIPETDGRSTAANSFLEMLVNEGEGISSSSASAALASSSTGWVAISQGPVPVLGQAFSSLQSLQACLVRFEHLIDLMGLPSDIPYGLRSLHVGFTDASLKGGDDPNSDYSTSRPWLSGLTTAPNASSLHGNASRISPSYCGRSFWRGLASS